VQLSGRWLGGTHPANTLGCGRQLAPQLNCGSSCPNVTAVSILGLDVTWPNAAFITLFSSCNKAFFSFCKGKDLKTGSSFRTICILSEDKLNSMPAKCEHRFTSTALRFSVDIEILEEIHCGLQNLSFLLHCKRRLRHVLAPADSLIG